MNGSDHPTRVLKAACFDLDGTLVDTGPLHVEAERLALVALGIPEPALDHPLTFGAGILPGMEMLAEHYGIPSPEHVLEAYLPAWESAFESGLKPMPGADEVLRLLHGSGIPLALVTSGENEYVDKVLEQLEWSRYFTHRVSLESVDNLKPHPEPYLTAANLLSTPPEQCAGIEDSASGLGSLAAAGFYSVLVQSDSGSKNTELTADANLNSLLAFDETFASRLFVG